ncbi:MAG: hypothetical protein WC842_02225 [Candidatus Paceibacterota bacterium]|jgi:hypothetical protein
MLIHIDLELTISDDDAPEKQIRELCEYIVIKNPIQKNVEHAFALIEPLIGWNKQDNGNLLLEDAETILALLDTELEFISVPQIILNNRTSK